MRLVITGSSGLLGRACARGCAARGWGVVGVDRAASGGGVSGGGGGVRAYVGTLHDPYTIHRALDLCERELGGAADAVVHLANHTNARSAGGEVVLRENLAMNASVFAGAIERGVRRVVFASSIQAFLGGIDGSMELQDTMRPPRFPIDETIEPRPTNGYGLSKLLSERMLDGLCGGGVSLVSGSAVDAEPAGSGGAVGGCTGVSVRLPYVLTDRSFEMVGERARRGEFAPVEYRWGGAEAFSYVHADDASDALLAAADPDGCAVGGHAVVWVAADEPRTWESAGALVERFYGDVPGSAEAAARGSFHDLTRARSVLGWEARRLLSAVRGAAR
ncbi:MAG: NAD-dependent epimerase/dehydratase family protein [Phycisphaerales bacterium]